MGGQHRWAACHYIYFIIYYCIFLIWLIKLLLLLLFVLLLVVVGDSLKKILKLRRFKSDRDEI